MGILHSNINEKALTATDTSEKVNDNIQTDTFSSS